MKRRLTNDDWGLESNCFVCEARNDDGLQLEMWVDEDAAQVDADFELGNAFSGAPTLVHGGLSLAILDEVQAWAVIALEHSWAMTVTTSATFRQPVWIDHTYRAVAEVTTRDGDRVETVGWIEDSAGVRCVESQASFTIVGEATAASLIGGDVPGRHQSYLREEAEE